MREGNDLLKEVRNIDGRNCYLYQVERPEYILIQPVGDHDLEGLDQEIEAIANGLHEPGFLLLAFKINDWNQELSPWEAPAVFGKENFGSGAEETLKYVKKSLLPYIRILLAGQLNLSLEQVSQLPLILGGYSLAAFFALWAAYQTDCFAGVAAASPSVWFPDWMDYVKANEICVNTIYLSLGDKEEKAKNPVMARVGDCIRELADMYGDSPSLSSTLEWNQGNHFKDPDIRTAKAFVWCIKELEII